MKIIASRFGRNLTAQQAKALLLSGDETEVQIYDITREEAEAMAAKFPAWVGVKVSFCSSSNRGEFATFGIKSEDHGTHEIARCISIRVKPTTTRLGQVSKTTGGANETGIKRVERFFAVLATI